MSENLQPESMQSWMRSVEKRLAAVERPTRLSTVQYGLVEPAAEAFNQQGTTSASFVTLYRIPLSLIIADSVSVRTRAILFSGATGQVRLRAPNVSGTPTTSALSLPAGTNAFCQFDWTVAGLNLGDTGIVIEIQGRKTGGSFDLVVESPVVAMQTPAFSVNATATGNPRIL
jgi:hypothetical protein